MILVRIAAAVVVGLGYAAMGQTPSFRGLGDLPGGAFNSYAAGVSGDGKVVVGSGVSAASDPYYEAFRWTAETGMVPLGDLPGGIYASYGVAASGDGSVLVGESGADHGDEVVIWSGGTATRLGYLSGYDISSAAGVSRDARIVVGTNSSFTQVFEPFRWTQQTGMVGLGIQPGFSGSIAKDISGDGSVIVGFSQGGGQYAGWRWTVATGLQALPGSNLAKR